MFVGRYGCVCVRVERVGCVLRDGGSGGRHGGVCSKRWGMCGDVCGGRATVWLAVRRDQRGVCVCVCVCVCITSPLFIPLLMDT